MKIAINRCYGGFSVSQGAGKELKKLGVKLTLKGEKWEDSSEINSYEEINLDNEKFGIKNENYDAYRTDKRLIKVLEKLGDKANTKYSDIIIVKIPDDVDWEIYNYDGMETIHEKHRSW